MLKDTIKELCSRGLSTYVLHVRKINPMSLETEGNDSDSR